MKNLVDAQPEYELPEQKSEERRAFEVCMSEEDWYPVRDLYHEIDCWINKNTGRRVDDLDAFKGWENTGTAPVPF